MGYSRRKLEQMLKMRECGEKWQWMAKEEKDEWYRKYGNRAYIEFMRECLKKR